MSLKRLIDSREERWRERKMEKQGQKGRNRKKQGEKIRNKWRKRHKKEEKKT